MSLAAPAVPATKRRTASLPMYALPEIATDVDALWAALRTQLRRRRVADVPDALERPSDLHRTWEDPRLLVSQTCGYPLVAVLRSTVDVVGTFAHAVVSPEGHYRSALVAAPGARRRVADGAWADLRAAVNDHWSLSGLISLLAATAVGSRWPGPEVRTGSHVASLEALRSGSADIASIDAVTMALLARHRPKALQGLDVVGEGPLVPCLPIVTAARGPVAVPVLRDAIADALADPAMRSSLRRQLIERFIPLDVADYAPVADVVAGLGVVAPRWR